MPDKLPDSLERLPSTPSPELEDEVRIGNVKYKRIEEKEEQNPGGESDDSPSPAQQSEGQRMNLRETLQGRTIVKVSPESADGSEESFEQEITLHLDDGMQVEIYVNCQKVTLEFSAVHRDNK